jgi:hypothetical protein
LVSLAVEKMSVSSVISICQKLTKEGKTPTTALVKMHLQSPLPLAQVLKGLQLFQANPNQAFEVPEHKEEPVQSACCNCGEKIAVLQRQLDAIKLELKALQEQALAK